MPSSLKPSSIESQLLPCAPACAYKFHALAVDVFRSLGVWQDSKCNSVQ